MMVVAAFMLAGITVGGAPAMADDSFSSSSFGFVQIGGTRTGYNSSEERIATFRVTNYSSRPMDVEGPGLALLDVPVTPHMTDKLELTFKCSPTSDTIDENVDVVWRLPGYPARYTPKVVKALRIRDTKCRIYDAKRDNPNTKPTQSAAANGELAHTGTALEEATHWGIYLTVGGALLVLGSFVRVGRARRRS